MPTPLLSAHNPLLKFYWFGLSVLLLVADYFSGPFIQFPVTYLIPVALASWYSGRGWGLALAIVLPLVRFYFNTILWIVPWTITEATINAVIRILVLTSFALIIDRTANQTRRLSKEVHLLEGFLPICSYCKRIRDESNQWQQMEEYITDRSAAVFSHGLCPDCAQKYYGDVLKGKE